MARSTEVMDHLRTLLNQARPAYKVTVKVYGNTQAGVLYICGADPGHCVKVQIALDLSNGSTGRYLEIRPLLWAVQTALWVSPKGMKQTHWWLPYRKKKAEHAALLLFEAFEKCGFAFLDASLGQGETCLTCPLQLKCLTYKWGGEAR